MELRIRLEKILARVNVSARELELQPEAFQATQELRLAAGELSMVIQELDGVLVIDGSALSEIRPKTPANPGTGLALARPSRLAA